MLDGARLTAESIYVLMDSISVGRAPSHSPIVVFTLYAQALRSRPLRPSPLPAAYFHVRRQPVVMQAPCQGCAYAIVNEIKHLRIAPVGRIGHKARMHRVKCPMFLSMISTTYAVSGIIPDGTRIARLRQVPLAQKMLQAMCACKAEAKSKSLKKLSFLEGCRPLFHICAILAHSPLYLKPNFSKTHF